MIAATRAPESAPDAFRHLPPSPPGAVLRATAMLAGSSIVQVGALAALAKVWALALGPRGYGLAGLEQSLIRVALIVAGIGLGPGLVRLAAAALARGDQIQVASLQRACWWLTAAMAAGVGLVFLLARHWLALWALGDGARSGDVLGVGLALALNLVYATQTSVLNARHRVRDLAQIAVLGNLTGVIPAAALVLRWHETGVAWALIWLAGANCGVAHHFLAKLPKMPAPSWTETVAAGRALLQFGIPYMLSAAVGGGVQMAIPFVVLQLLDQRAVGLYRAAAGISVVYLSFLLNSMSLDYFPRLAAAGRSDQNICALINQQHRFMVTLALPAILALMALAPFAVPLMYSREFLPCVALLEWQLAGDVLKLASWTMSFAILARLGSGAYFFTELIGGTLVLGFSLIGGKLWGLAGLGIAYCATYVVYYLVEWAWLTRSIQWQWTPENRRLLAWALLAVCAVRFCPAAPWPHLRLLLAASLAMLATASALRRLRPDWIRASNSETAC